MTTTKMTPLDRSWFFIESERVPVHGAFLCVFSPPSSAKHGHAKRVLAAMMRRPVAAPFNLKANLKNPLSPRWETTDVELSRHVIATTLAAPGSNTELLAAAADAVRQPLDRSLPLWRVHWFDGLEKGQFALLFVLHHAQWDGIAIFRMMREFMSTSEKSTQICAPWEGVSTWKKVVSDSAKSTGQGKSRATGNRIIGLLRESSNVVRDLSRVLAQQGMEKLRGTRDIPLPLSAPEARPEYAASAERTYGLVNVDVKRVKAIANTTATSFNDVLTTVVDAAYAKYLADIDMSPAKPLVALVPIAIKTQGAGNQISASFVSLGKPKTSLLARLKAVSENMSSAKTDISSMSVLSAKVWAMLAMGVAATPDLLKIADRLPMSANMMISNPFGIPETLYLGPNRLSFFAPLIGPSLGTRVMFGIYSYADRTYISVTSLKSVVPDIAQLSELVTATFDAMEAAVLKKSAKPAARVKAAPKARKTVSVNSKALPRNAGRQR